MKHMKKVFSLLLTLLMIVGMMTTAFAEESGYKITIKDTKGTAANSFAAYQVFAGSLSEDGKTLSDITWGSGVKGDELEEALNVTSAEEAAALLTAAENAMTADAFAAIVAEHLSDTCATAAADTKNGDAVISVQEVGYYFIKNNAAPGDNEAYTKYILQVVNNVTLEAKTDAPSIDKKIKNEGEPVSAYREGNNVAVGDTVNYLITSKVPDMSNYSQYYFIVNDTLSKGLTYTEGSMAVKIGDQVLVEGDAYSVSFGTDENDATTIEIVFKEFIQYKELKGSVIEITYDAVLNKDCVIGSNGNPNNVDLTYSNNPNETGKGVDKPNDDEKDEVTGTTPKEWTITYTTDLDIFKTDENGTALKDATFTITGIKKNNNTTYTEEFVEDENGSYYKLNDGSYTQEEPTELTMDQYADTEKTYSITVVAADNSTVETVNLTATSGEDGYAKFEGTFSAGEYVITEVKAPDGYNMLKAPITIVITSNSDGLEVSDGTETTTWTITKDGVEVTGSIDATYVLNIENHAGSMLPTTGGIGTTIFYVIGSVFVLAAGIVLVTRRRMSVK